jgi:SOS-response transcriptional repressor LexA
VITLTPAQTRLLRFIAGYARANHGLAPTLAECAIGIGTPAKSRVHALLVQLERRGAIRRLPRRERAIEILSHVAVPEIAGTPLYAVPMKPSTRQWFRFDDRRLP